MEPLWDTVQSEGVQEKITRNYSRIVGYIERFLYTTALLLQHYGIIGVWLAFKVAGRWERAKKQFDDLYNGNKSNPKNKMKAHAIYSVFIIGNGLSIVYAVIGYKIVVWMQSNQSLQLFKIISILLLTIIVTRIMKDITKKISEQWSDLKYKCSLCGQEFYDSEEKVICNNCYRKNIKNQENGETPT